MEVLSFMLKSGNYTLDTMAMLYLIKFLFCHEINLNKRIWIGCAFSQILFIIIERMIFNGENSLYSLVIFSIIIIFLCYGIKGLKKIIYIVPTAFVMLLPLLMITLIFSMFASQTIFNWSEELGTYFGTLLDVIIIIMIKRKIEENYYVNLKRWDIISIISVNTLSLIILIAIDELQKTIIFDEITDKIIFIIITFITILMDMSTAISIIKSKSAIHYKNINEINEYYMETQLQHFESYKNSQKETRSLKHDMKNHLICINDLCAQGKYKELNDYVKNLQDNITILDSVFNTGDSIADSIINEKHAIMKNNNISFELSGNFQEKCLIKPVHMCTIFANAIDNAIEACIKIEDTSMRRISIEIKNSRNFLVLSFTNSIKEQLIIKDNKIKTNKPDKENHGFGLENIRATVKKYNGDFDIKVTQDTFELEVVLTN
ncbi:sensor histidine kinase [Clostridium gelidum]|uniref:Sensor histidine kinase n=1 Tax=Clostridium gelidum TaxID=704125 RepID=A0ABN6IVF2_9CLOT|nr:ATP-binding protein [Clostridium gelidum]BCZ45393.1 sensor histidine kinase [Clostridium gelidum]